MATELPNTQDLQQIGPLKTSKEFGNLFAALMNAQAEFPVIKKDQTASIASSRANYKYLYADLTQVQQAITPILKKHGLVLITPVVGNTLVTCLMLPISSEWMIAEWPIKLSGTPQQWGSEVTYVRRYSIGAMLNLVIDEDDDGGAASQPQQQESRQTNQQKSAPRQQSQSQTKQQQGDAQPSESDKQFWSDWCDNCGMQGLHTSEAKKLLGKVLSAVEKQGISDLTENEKVYLLTECVNDACESFFEKLQKKKQGNANTTGQSLADVDARRQQRAAG